MSPSSDQRIFLSLNFCVAALGMIFVLFCTPWGVGLSPDSTHYLAAARSLMKGQGLMGPPQWGHPAPYTLYGPLFPALLGAVGFLGKLDPLAGAKLLNAFFFGGNIFLAGWMVFDATRSLKAALVTAWITAASYVLLQIHAVAYSEPAALFFALLGFYTLSVYLEEEKRRSLLIAAAGFLGLAFLTRYAALAVVAAGVFSFLLLSQKPAGEKLRDAALMIAVGCFPMFLWFLRNKSVVGSPLGTGASFTFQSYNLRPLFLQMLAYMSIWPLPKSVPAVLRGVCLFAGVLAYGAGLAALFKTSAESSCLPEETQTRIKKLSAILLVFIVMHLGIYAATNAFLGKEALDDRALSCVHLALILLGALASIYLVRLRKQHKFLRAGLIGLAFFFSVTYLGRAWVWGRNTRAAGLGYASPEWSRSETILEIAGLPEGIPIYSNGMDAVYILTGRASSPVPAKEHYLKIRVPDAKERAVESYAGEMEQMKKILQEHDGVLVYLKNIRWRWYYPSEAELVQKLSLVPVKSLSDGTIYKVGIPDKRFRG